MRVLPSLRDGSALCWLIAGLRRCATDPGLWSSSPYGRTGKPSGRSARATGRHLIDENLPPPRGRPRLALRDPESPGAFRAGPSGGSVSGVAACGGRNDADEGAARGL